MEKDTNRNTHVLQGDDGIGSVQIADEVVAMIASLAAMEVEGVYSLAGKVTNELMSKVGVKNLTRGVKVQVTGSSVRADLALSLLLALIGLAGLGAAWAVSGQQEDTLPDEDD